MNIAVDTDGSITGYTELGGFLGGIEIEDSELPEGFVEDFWPRKYRLESGVVVASGVVRPTPHEAQAVEPSTEDLLLEMAGDHEYRLCLLELGVDESDL